MLFLDSRVRRASVRENSGTRTKAALSQQLDHSYCFLFQEVIRNLVKRYVAAMIRTSKTNEGLTEENFKVIYYSLRYYLFILLFI